MVVVAVVPDPPTATVSFSSQWAMALSKAVDPCWEEEEEWRALAGQVSRHKRGDVYS